MDNNIFNDFDCVLAGNLDYTPVYHYTKVIRLYNILKTDILSASGENCICVTRDSHFYTKGTLGISVQSYIKLNRDMLKHKYKIVPHKFDALKLDYDEQEERIYTTRIPHISKYITLIKLFPSTIPIDGYKNQYVLRRAFKGAYDNDEPDMMFDEIYNILSSFNIPVEVYK